MRNELKGIISKLRGLEALLHLYQQKAEIDADGERVDRLDEEIQAINTAIEALEEID